MNIRKNIDYSELYAGIDKALAANLSQMELYLELGRLVSGRPERGAAVMAAEHIAANYPNRTGFSPRNLRRMRDFYRMYESRPEVLAQAMKIGWTQNIIILEADLDMGARCWYLQAVRRFGWSKIKLTEQIINRIHLENDSDLCYTKANFTIQKAMKDDKASTPKRLCQLSESSCKLCIKNNWRKRAVTFFPLQSSKTSRCIKIAPSYQRKYLMSKNITHKNHYVPQFYLKNWSKDGKTLYVYSILVANENIPLWKQVSIRNTAVWPDLYTRKNEVEEIDDFERWFSSEFEAPGKPIFDKVIRGKELSDSENILLSKFIIAQKIRTPAMLGTILDLGREKFSVAMEKVMQKFIHEVAEGINLSKKHYVVQDDPDIPIAITFDRKNRLLESKMLIGKSMYLHMIKHLLSTAEQYIHKYYWQVIEADSRISFPTSDNPIVYFNYLGNGCYNFDIPLFSRFGYIIMPISPKKLLFCQIGKKSSAASLSNSIDWSILFRRMIIQHAHKFVFAEKPHECVSILRPRTISKELFEEERFEMIHWHGSNMAAENDFFNSK